MKESRGSVLGPDPEMRGGHPDPKIRGGWLGTSPGYATGGGVAVKTRRHHTPPLEI